MFRRKDEGAPEATETTGATASTATSSTPASAAKPASESTSSPGASYGSNNDASNSSAASAPTPAAAKPAAAAPAQPFRPQVSPNLGASRSSVPAASSASSSPAAKSNKRVLTVGNDIHMKGEISTCDRLVIEGSVDATLKDVHTVELAETGSFKGNAEIVEAEISGNFEGDLVCSGRLIIYSTGKVKGNISYGEIEIERGGQISGSIQQGKDAAAKNTKRAA